MGTLGPPAGPRAGGRSEGSLRHGRRRNLRRAVLLLVRRDFPPHRGVRCGQFRRGRHAPGAVRDRACRQRRHLHLRGLLGCGQYLPDRDSGRDADPRAAGRAFPAPYVLHAGLPLDRGASRRADARQYGGDRQRDGTAAVGRRPEIRFGEEVRRAARWLEGRYRQRLHLGLHPEFRRLPHALSRAGTDGRTAAVLPRQGCGGYFSQRQRLRLRAFRRCADLCARVVAARSPASRSRR